MTICSDNKAGCWPLDKWQYLGFEYKGVHYCFNNLPFWHFHCMRDLQHQQAEIVQASKGSRGLLTVLA